MLNNQQLKQFQELLRAAKSESLALVEVKHRRTGELFGAICAVNTASDAQITIVPYGIVFNEDPFIDYEPTTRSMDVDTAANDPV